MIQDIELNDGSRLKLRPVEPGDTEAILDLGRRCSPEDLRLRFFTPVRVVEGPLSFRLTHPDPQHEVALAAYDPDGPGGAGAFLGVGRLIEGAAPGEAEFAVLVRTDLKGHGLGHKLMEVLLAAAAERGLTRVYGDVLYENKAMLQLARELGARTEHQGPAWGVVRVVFDLPLKP